MKFKYDLTGHLFHCYNVVYGILLRRKRIKKYDTKKVDGYLRSSLLLFGLVFFLFLLMVIFSMAGVPAMVFDIATWLLTCLVFLLSLYYLTFYITFLSNRKQSHKGVLSIEDDGICDTSACNISIKFSWQAVENIVVKKNVVVVFGEYPVILFATITHPKKFVEEVKKYTDRIVVVK